MPVTADDLRKLRDPFGELLPDREVSKERISSVTRGAKKVVTVGDATTERLFSLGIIPDIAVIDGRERRTKSSRQINYRARELSCANPSGTISKEAMEILARAVIENKQTRVFVSGEEDMLALPLFYMLPVGSVVLYGQPLEGIVAVKITKSKQKEAKDLMDRIGIN
jgi:GTP-dependent dephospho-CoA kinase